ncbi:MAG: hypothetical protein ACRCUI_14890 [Polymorphobacter sp.]
MRLPVLGVLVLLAACTTPAQRITRELVQIGVPEAQARCVGDRLADRLSNDQLRRLAELAQANKDKVGRMSLNDIARQIGQPGDSAMLSQVLRAGISCAI